MKNTRFDRFNCFQSASLIKAYALAFFVLVCFFRPLNVHAQSQNITITPPKFELFANPGESVTEQIRVRNDSEFPVTYGILLEDFSTAGEEGQVVLEEPNNTNYSLARWIEPESKDLVLQPGEERPITFTINIPKDAEPGGHYASLLFTTGGEPMPGAASVSQRVGSLILLRVSGNVSETASIESFTIPSYSQKGPVIFTLRVKNEGNVHIRPKGTIIVTNLFGKKVDEIPLNGANVIPGAIRKMETEWSRENLLGIYTATMVATYGQQNIPLTAATRFTVASTTTLIILAVAVITGIILLISLISGRKRLLKAIRVITSND